MKKVAIFTNSAWGAYNFRLNLARVLRESGYEVFFIFPEDKKYASLIKKEFPCESIYMDAKAINPLKDLKTILAIYKVLKRTKPQTILNFTIKPNIYGSVVSSFLGIKSISNVTGLGTIFITQSIVTKIAKILYKIALSCNFVVFFQNSEDRELFVKNSLVQSIKAKLLPGSGVDTKRFQPLHVQKDNSFVFLMIARLLRDKGVYEYIEAVKILKKSRDDVEFWIAGEIDSINKTAISKDLLDSWVDEGLVKYLGVSDKIEEIIAKSDCVVLPSYREGTPRSLLEACAMAKPIIATDTVGCKEVVDDGENGFLCRVKDGKDLAKKMRKMLFLTEEQRAKMGISSRKKVEKEFDERIVIRRYLELL